MQISKAREILNLNIKVGGNKIPPDVKQSLKLGAEAINYIIRLRAFSLEHRQARLPSEDAVIVTTPPYRSIKEVRESPLGQEPKG